MHSIDKETIVARYRDRILKSGHTPASLGEPKGRQGFYFEFLLKFDGLGISDSIVDIGCGYGDLYAFLRSKGWRGEYLGIDIVPDLIEEARRRYPDAKFRVQDIQDDPLSETFDWCISCHALTSDTQGSAFLDHLKDMLLRMWSASRRGVIFNMLSPLADYTNPIHARPPLEFVLGIVTSLTRRFSLRHDYMPFEYAVYAYKNDSIDRELLIFAEHRLRFDAISATWRPEGNHTD